MEHTELKLLNKPKLQALPLDKPLDKPLHDKHKEKEHEHFLGNIFNWAGAAVVGLSVAPLALRQIGIGVEQAKLE
ncbi:MAG: hypothetical protein ACKO96_14670, partial [Flammeovirgaceae bacterium]